MYAEGIVYHLMLIEIMKSLVYMCQNLGNTLYLLHYHESVTRIRENREFYLVEYLKP